jgi:hypothetical protein
MKLTDLTRKTRKIEVSYLGEAANIEYKVAAVTPTFLAELKGLDSVSSIIHQISRVVIVWDVVDENDMMIPLTEKSIRDRDIPVGFLSEILTAITADMASWGKPEKKD